jgi:hypothetical protein
MPANFNIYMLNRLKCFWKQPAKASKNSDQFGHHIFLNTLNVLKPLSFEGSLHITKENNTTRKTGIVLKILDEALA